MPATKTKAKRPVGRPPMKTKTRAAAKPTAKRTMKRKTAKAKR